MELDILRQSNVSRDAKGEFLTFARCPLQTHSIDILNWFRIVVSDDSAENYRNAADHYHGDYRAVWSPRFLSGHLLLLLEVLVIDAALAIFGEKTSGEFIVCLFL